MQEKYNYKKQGRGFARKNYFGNTPVSEEEIHRRGRRGHREIKT